jgi:hypothetical protein
MMVNDKNESVFQCFLAPFFVIFFSRMSVFEVLNFGLPFTYYLINYYLLPFTFYRLILLVFCYFQNNCYLYVLK